MNNLSNIYILDEKILYKYKDSFFARSSIESRDINKVLSIKYYWKLVRDISPAAKSILEPIRPSSYTNFNESWGGLDNISSIPYKSRNSKILSKNPKKETVIDLALYKKKSIRDYISMEDKDSALICSFVSDMFITNGINLLIIGYKESARIFGLKKVKQSLVGKSISTYRILGVKKLPEKKYSGIIVELQNPDSSVKKMMKFCIEDLSFDIDEGMFKGFTAPKDKTIREEAIVKLKKHSKYPVKVKENEAYVISSIVKRNLYTRKPEVLEVMDKNMNKFKVNSKDIKVI